MAYANTEFASKLAPIVDLDDPTFDRSLAMRRPTATRWISGRFSMRWKPRVGCTTANTAHILPYTKRGAGAYNLDYYTVFGYDNARSHPERGRLSNAPSP